MKNLEIKDLEIKIFAASVLLQELLDATEGKTAFIHKTRFHINRLQEQLDKLNGVVIDQEAVSLLVNRGVQALEDSFDTDELPDNDNLSED